MMQRLAVLFAAAMATASLAQPVTTESRVIDLERRVKSLEQRVFELESGAKASPSPGAEIPGQRGQPMQTPVARAPAPVTYRKVPFTVSLLDKKESETTSESGAASPEFRFMLMYTNGLSKPIGRFLGDLKFLDPAGKELMSMEMDIILRIPAGKQSSWMGAVSLNGKNPNHAFLLTADKEQIKTAFVLKKVKYADGSDESFAMEQ